MHEFQFHGFAGRFPLWTVLHHPRVDESRGLAFDAIGHVESEGKTCLAVFTDENLAIRHILAVAGDRDGWGTASIPDPQSLVHFLQATPHGMSYLTFDPNPATTFAAVVVPLAEAIEFFDNLEQPP